MPGTSAAAPGEEGQFNVNCRWQRTAPEDPIVAPGRPGDSHLHVFFGNESIRADSTPESLRDAPEPPWRDHVRCHRRGDRSAYWIPAAYAKLPPRFPPGATPPPGFPPPPPEPEGPVFLRPYFYAVAYYRTAGRRPASIRPFPPGLKMIAGDAHARRRQPTDIVSWKCMVHSDSTAYVDPGAVRRLRRALLRQQRALRRLRARGERVRAGRRLRRIAAALRAARRGERDGSSGCSQGELKLSIRFPDCWDGRRLDAPDHKSHMAESRRMRKDGLRACPASHPVSVPKLTLNVRYEGRPSRVRLASGPTFTAHADFMNAWDPAALAALVRRCLNADRFCGRR